jgi:hypothetical protein
MTEADEAIAAMPLRSLIGQIPAIFRRIATEPDDF